MNGYDDVAKMGIALSPNQESTRDRLVRTKKSLEERIADINLALQLLDRNPEMEQLQDLLRRI